MNASVRDLRFRVTKKHEDRIKIIELQNSSSINAEFLFDNLNSMFEVDKTIGVIPANNYIFVKVKYIGKKHGFYSGKLCILIRYHVSFST